MNDNIRNWLETMVEFHTRLNERNKAPPRPYVCMEDFILRHGHPNVGRRLPKGYELGEIKQCFANSQRELALQGMTRSEELTFVEGYVLSPKLFPIHHGWLEDSAGRVVDLTLRGANEATAYFGVSFRTFYVMRMVRQHMMWGTLLDNHWAKWPLLRGEHSAEEALVATQSGV